LSIDVTAFLSTDACTELWIPSNGKTDHDLGIGGDNKDTVVYRDSIERLLKHPHAIARQFDAAA
jgi:hypothetical protein